jgi:geranylgeranyl diphosphate synthase, type I
MEAFVNYLGQYNRDIEPVITREFNNLTDRARRYEEVTGRLIGDYQHLMMEGKRLRGCLFVLGYEMFGGEGAADILRASLDMEITHTALLIHDDIMDRSPIRRGEPTIHVKYGEQFGEHNGEALAITAGDIGYFYALENFIEGIYGVPQENYHRALLYLTRRYQQVGLGQALDIVYEKLRKFDEEDVRKIHDNKTAQYTIYGPLGTGALLAGATDEQVTAIEQYGVPVGIAFQLRDDELDMFSTAEEIGKPVGSDTKAGKVTLLISKALELASKEDQGFLEEWYGNRRIRNAGIERVKQIIEGSGALAYSQELSRRLVEEGKRVITRITSDPKYQAYLSELADLGIQRTS